MRPQLLAFTLLVACGGSDETTANSGDVSMTVAPLTTVARGGNSFAIHIEHPHEVAVEATAWMPAMGHGATTAPRIAKIDGENFRLDEVIFSMAGAWDLRVTVACSHGISTRTFRYEVP